jgi:cell division protein ZipA
VPAASSAPAQDFSEVLVLNVVARPNHEIAGVDLLQVLLANQLRFGDMAIFHRHVDGAARSPVLFSVANLVNPGTFDLNRISEFSTRGVCFFMTLPSVGNNMQAFDKMLEAAQQVRIALDADLKDDNRSVMTAQTIEHYRQRVRDFDLRQLRQPK